MLEMMPGSVLDKTNNNLSNLVCAHSTIGQKTDPGREKGMEAALKEENPVSYINNNSNELEMNKNNELTPNETIDNVPEKINDLNVSTETIENKVVTQDGSTNEDVSMEETTEINIVSQETSQETNENNVDSSKTIKYVAVSQKQNNKTENVLVETSESIAETAETNVSPETIVSQELNKEFDILDKTFLTDVSEKTSEYYFESKAGTMVKSIDSPNKNIEIDIVDKTVNQIVLDHMSENKVLSQKINKESDVLNKSHAFDVVLDETLEVNISSEEISANKTESIETPVKSREENKESDILDKCDILSLTSNSKKKNENETGSINMLNISQSENKEFSIANVVLYQTPENNISQLENKDSVLNKMSITDTILDSTLETFGKTDVLQEKELDASSPVIYLEEKLKNNVIPEEIIENKVEITETLDVSLEANKESDILDKSDIVLDQTLENNVIIPKINENKTETMEKLDISQKGNNESDNLVKSFVSDVLDQTTKNDVITPEINKNMAETMEKLNISQKENNDSDNLNITFVPDVVLDQTSENDVITQDINVNIQINETPVISKETSEESHAVLDKIIENINDSPETPESNVLPQINACNVETENNFVAVQKIENKEQSVNSFHEKDIDQCEKMEIDSIPDIVIKEYEKLETDCIPAIVNKCEKMETNSTNLFNKKKIKNKENKLLSFLEKNKLTINDLIPKLKYFKRQTKDRRKPNCVLSLKLNRFYFKINKPKWSPRQRGKPKKPKKEKPQILPPQSSSSSLDLQTGEDTQDSVVLDFKADDDIRNKIKEQLVLLRQSKKQKITPETEEMPELEESTPMVPETSREEKSNPPLKSISNLDDVVLSKGDGELSIVSVVGGYFSDEDSPYSVEKVEKKEYSSLAKGVSMADILLKREFNSHLITPTKTNDITKIKGWRTKHFAPKEEDPEEQEQEKKTTQMENTIENPIPSTSFDFVENKSENILKSGEKTVEKNTKSAFVSDELDSFLNHHSELKISYEVPKLVAEETISKPQSEIPVENSNYLKVVNKTPYKTKPMCNKVSKPKTLAEKRRMLEKDRQNQLLHDMEINESVYLKQLEYCEKRNKNDVAKDVRENLLAKETPISRHCWNMATKLDKYARQFVVVNGNKIRILGSYGGNDIVVPNEVKRKPTIMHKREVIYKPGPLSKKHKLISNKENWECKVLKMPKIKLVVCPEPGKSLPLIAEQYIQLYRGEKGYIDDELAKFAVSAVRTTTTVKNKFEFDVPYRNGQNKLIVRKKIYRPFNREKRIHIPKNDYIGIDVEDSIKTVMSNMLNCVENQELDKVIIKDDPDLRNKIDKHVDRPPSPIDPRVQAIIKRPNARKSKTTLELRRLNVQVIEVDVKEEEQESVACNKDFCKLGCVCKSLRGATSLVPEHCGKVNCMLECSCNFSSSQRGHHSITLPAGTDLLSASTVVRLQDEVKKNLAKEEREFAQTVIKANNQTIMVGGGARERARRIPKVPKKYSNFVSRHKGFSYEKLVSSGLLEEVDDDFEQQISKQTIQKVKEEVKKEPEQRILEVELKKPVPIWNKEQSQKMQEIRNCHIKVTKLKLDNTVPWCMVHNLYKCHCDGKAVFETTPVKIEKKDEIEKIEEEEYITYAPRFQPRIIPESNPPTITDLSEKYCARTRAIGTNYYQARNKSQSFKARYALIKLREFQAQELRQEILKSSKLPESKDEPIVSDKQELLIPRTNKKKMTLVNIEDILKRDEKPKPTAHSNPNPCHVVSAASFIDYERSFLGLLTPSSEWLEKFHKMLNLNLNTVIRQIRLLEWATLVRRHNRGILQLWFNNKKYNNIILTEDKKRPSKYHLNIKTFQSHALQNYRLPEIITSLYTNKLPGVATKATETYVILVYNGISWEARGTIVLNDTSEMCKQRLGHKPTPIHILKPVLIPDKSVLPRSQKNTTPVPTQSPANVNSVNINLSHVNPNILIRSTSSVSVEVVNKEKSATPINKPMESGLEITKIPMQSQNQNMEVIKPKKDNHILAPLPTGFGMSRWFMLILKNDFSVIRISFSNFHIKYTHLITAIETAKKNKKTVRIRSQDKNVDNPNNFGVYALPGFPDRIFFGPYDSESEHGLETFRYVNGKLVNTKIYHKMRGSVEKNTTGIWYFHSSTVQNNLVLEPQKDSASSGSDCSTEVTSAEKAVKPHIEFVDLTENDSDTEETQPVDPLFNVLSADFSKKVSGDITIEPVYENNPKTILHEVKKNDVIIQPIINDDTARLSVIQKENGMMKRKSGQQPKLIDSIELDDDEEEPPKKRRHSDVMKQVPELCPINAAMPHMNEVLRKKKVIYVITNIPGIGYFEISITDKRCMRMHINGKTTTFPTISMALTWLHQLLRRYVFIMPVDLKVKFSILESGDVPEMPKFEEKYLNGCHMMCEKGVFDVLRLSTEDLINLGFDEQQSANLLAHKCELLINRNIKVLGNYLVGPEESSKLGKEKILQIAPRQIKIIESRENFLQQQKQELKAYQAELMVKLNELLKGVPETLKKLTKDKIYDISKISRDENAPLPAGKMKIMDGKLVRVESPSKYEMLVPIAGLQTPVTVVGVQPQKQSPSTSLLKIAQQKVVDLTDD